MTQDLFRHLRIHTASKRCETCALYECVVEECNCICHEEKDYEWKKESTIKKGVVV